MQSKARIICKGGTSLNKIYLGSMQRFSEDIDLDIFFMEDMARDDKIKFIRDEIIAPLKGPYIIPKEARRKDVIHFTCKFKNEIGMDYSVFVEFELDKEMIGESRIARAVSSILPLSVDAVPVYTLETLIAKKLKAFYERSEGKDIYDIYSCLKITDDMGTMIGILRDTLASKGIRYDDFKARVQEKLKDGSENEGSAWLCKPIHAKKPQNRVGYCRKGNSR